MKRETQAILYHLRGVKKRFSTSSIVLGMIALVVIGCDFAVKDTAGIERFLTDQTKAERYALRVKQRFPDAQSSQYKQAQKTYARVVDASDAFITSVQTASKTKNKIDVSEKYYLDHHSQFHQLSESFVKECETTLGSSVIPAGLGAEAADFVMHMIVGIKGIVDKEREAAVERLKVLLNNSRMLEFPQLDANSLAEKYKH